MEFPIIATRYDHVNVFVNAIAPIVCNEWLRRKAMGENRISPAVVIAQAGKESGWNLKAETLFGIKGSDLELNTTEFIDGAYVSVTDGFKFYPDIAGAVVGYFDLMQWENYDDATRENTVEGELEGLTNDVGYPYATAPDYKETTLDIIYDFNLKVFNDYVDSFNVETGGTEPGGVEEPDVETENEEETEERTVTVEPGGSFWQIANEYLGDGSRCGELAEYNDMSINDMLYAGMVLKLPD